MGNVRVILSKEYPLLGFIGDTVNVKRGYARNFLLPRGIAVEATSRNAKQLQHFVSQINAKKAQAKLESEKKKEALEVITLKFKLKVSESGRSFGSISAKDIEKELKTKGQKIIKKQIQLPEAFKTPGEYTVDIKIHSEVIAKVKVLIEAEKVVVKEEPKEKKKKKASKKEGAEEVLASDSESGSENTTEGTPDTEQGEETGSEEPQTSESEETAE